MFPKQGSINTPARPKPSLGSLLVEIVNEKVHSGLAAASLAFMFLLVGSISLTLPVDPSFSTGYPSSYASIAKAKAIVLGDSTTLPSGTVYPDARTVSPVKCRGGQLQNGQFCVYSFIDFSTGQHFVYPAPETATNQNPYITSTINNDWDKGVIKGTSGRKDNISIRWVGNIEFKKGLYAFSTRSDDGIRISVNSSRINLSATNGTSVQAYADHGPTDFKGYVYIETPGTKEIVVEYYENTGLAVAKVSLNEYLGDPLAKGGSSTSLIPNAKNYAELLGVTHVAGNYRFTNKTFLEEGTDAVAETGARTIGIWMGPDYQKQYHDSNLPAGITSLKALAETSPFKSVFANSNFDTYILTTYTFSNFFNTFDGSWNSPINQSIYNKEVIEMKDLAVYLSQTYPNKKFILKNWEGDWQVQGNFALNGSEAIPSNSRIEAMTNWLRARQEGVVQARTQTGKNNIYHAVEFNSLRKCDSNGQNCLLTRTNLLNNVIGNVDSDLLSYSAYGTTNGGDREKIFSDIQYIKSHPSAKSRNLILSEFVAIGGQDNVQMLKNQAKAFLDAGVVRAIYWEIYDNVCALNSTGTAQLDPNCVSFGLIDRTGARTPQFNTLKDLISSSSQQSYSILGIQRFNQNLTGNQSYINTDEMVVGQYMLLYGTFPSTGAEVWIGGEQVPASNVAAALSTSATTNQINVKIDKQYYAQASPTGFYPVVVKKNGVSSNEKLIRYQSSQTTTLTCPTPQNINGIVTSCYYNDKAPVYAHFQSVDLVETRITDGPTQDGYMFNKDWAKNTPGSKINPDHFSATYQGYFPFDGGEYKFTARTDDGMRVWIEASGVAYTVLDKFTDQGATTYTNTIKLPAGSHLVKVEYYENVGDAVASLRWDKLTPIETTKEINSVTVSPYTTPAGQSGYIKGYPIGVSWTASNITNGYTVELMFNDSGTARGVGILSSRTTSSSGSYSLPTSIGTGGAFFVRVCEYTTGTCSNGTSSVFKDSASFTAIDYPSTTTKAISSVSVSPYTASNGQEGYIKGYPVQVSWTASGITSFNAQLFIKSTDGSITPNQVFRSNITGNSIPNGAPIPTSVGTGAKAFIRICENTGSFQDCNNGTTYKDSDEFTISEITNKAITAVITAPYTTSSGTTGYIKGYPISVSWASTGLSIYTVELMLKFPDGTVGTAGGFVSKTTASSVTLPIPTNIGNGATGFVRVCEWTTGTCTNGYSDVYKDSSTFTINDLNQGGYITTTTGYYQAETGTTIVSPMQSAADGSNVGHVFTPQANSGSVIIPFNTTGSTQTYIVWAKVIAPDSSTDSFVVSIDGGGEDIFDTNDLNTNGTITYVAKPTWQWVRVNGRGGTGSPAIISTRAWNLAPGAHTITFKGRDANTKLDQIFITTNQVAVPQ